MTDFLINPARLSFRVPDLLSGLLVCGNKGDARPSAGNGDCILIDGAAGLIGVADCTERSPQASRRFLTSLSEHLAGSGPFEDRHRPDVLLAAARSVLEEFHYDDRTTFLCVLALPEGRVFYLNGGDSLLMQLGFQGSRIVFRNRPNMGFAGRCREILDSGFLEVADNDLFLLATDGLWDLLGDGSEDLSTWMPGALRSGSLDGLPHALVKGRHPAFSSMSGKLYDDLGLVLFRPFQTGSFCQRVLLGGTDSHSEEHYQDRLQRKGLPDCDLVLPEGPQSLWVLPDALDGLLAGPAPRAC